MNFDCSPTLRFERIPIIGRIYTRNSKRFPANVRYGDIVAGLPIPKHGCQGIYCSHVLEHLALEDFDIALRNTHDYLAAGGTFRFVLPDLEQLARSYLADADALAALHFMEESLLGRKHRSRGLQGLFSSWLGNSSHLWMWDEKSMALKLAEHGFAKIRRAAFGDAADKAFCEVEDKARFEGCLAMQCESI